MNLFVADRFLLEGGCKGTNPVPWSVHFLFYVFSSAQFGRHTLMQTERLHKERVSTEND